jgi:radical SAM superfamily enzyme YgiQ (UPF0313 family)
VALGGIHPSVIPEEVIVHCDAVLVGEAELTLPRFLGDFRRGKLEKFYRAVGMVDCWDQRLPRWELPDPKGHQFRASLTATRGCNHRCSFRSIHLALGSAQYDYRKKSPAEVARQALTSSVIGTFNCRARP